MTTAKNKVQLNETLMKELSVQLYKELTKNAFLIWNVFKVIVVNYVQAIWQSPVLNTIIKVWEKNTSTRQCFQN